MPNVPGSFQAKLPARFGMLGIRTTEGRLSEIVFLKPDGPALAPRDDVSERTCRQLEGYFEDPEFRFDVPLAAQGTAFQRRVWAKIAAIGAGCTRSYGELARELRSAPRAVGQACGANPVPLVVPCHRVLAARGIRGLVPPPRGIPRSLRDAPRAHTGGPPYP